MTSSDISNERALQRWLIDHNYALLPHQRRALGWRWLLRKARSEVHLRGAPTEYGLPSLPGEEKWEADQSSPTPD
jgi:hypothetical protein